MNWFRRMRPARLIALGFLMVILIGSILLVLPISVKSGQQLCYLDALFTATSAVCVTGLVVVDTYTTYTVFGQLVIAVLIQIGGLGVASMSVGIMLAVKRKVDMKTRNLVRESMNVDSMQGMVKLVISILYTTLFFESVGAVLNFCVFAQDYPLGRALWMSVFHAVATFNNAGFDIIGGMVSLIPYRDNVLLNLSTAGLILCGSIGFFVIRDVKLNRSFKKLQLHSKVVISVTVALTVFGTLLLKLAQPDITWLGAFFQSVTTRTAGFATYDFSGFAQGALCVLCLLMFIGASPGSTGGGIKTTTAFVLFHAVKEATSSHRATAFHYRISKDSYYKASVNAILALSFVVTGVFLMSLMEPQLALSDMIFELVSAFSTTGLSTGITTELCAGSKVLEIIMMYGGRVGVLTLVSVLSFRKEGSVMYPEGNITIG
ncbi:MAG: potassium transporter TrkG [Lachnospiraceae bacterium]|nr:potassium transporter TrkG [Lachnospiraceae bacterium]